MSFIAFDYGTKRVGVAGGDLSMGIAFPREVIENKSRDFLMSEVKRICLEWEVEMFVIGLPLNMEEAQEENPILKEIYEFGAELEKLGPKVVYFDERLSSFEAGQKQGELSKAAAKKDDALAAQIILQRYFDSLKT